MDIGEVEQVERPHPLSSIIQGKHPPGSVGTSALRALLRILAGSRVQDYLFEDIRSLEDTAVWAALDLMIAEGLDRPARNEPAFLERAKARFLTEAAQKQGNLEAVVIGAYHRIMGAPDHIAGPALEDGLDQDWLNSFTREADYASSSKVRSRLSALLAEEICSPRTFSRSTIRFVAEIEEASLQKFFALLPFRFADTIPTECSWSGGSMFELGLVLEEAGLVSGVRGFTHKQITFNQEGNGFMITNEAALTFCGRPGRELRLPVWMITSLGQQVAKMQPAEPSAIGLRRVALLIDKSELSAIHFGQSVDDGRRVTFDEQLWELPGDLPLAQATAT